MVDVIQHVLEHPAGDWSSNRIAAVELQTRLNCSELPLDPDIGTVSVAFGAILKVGSRVSVVEVVGLPCAAIYNEINSPTARIRKSMPTTASQGRTVRPRSLGTEIHFEPEEGSPRRRAGRLETKPDRFSVEEIHVGGSDSVLDVARRQGAALVRNERPPERCHLKDLAGGES